MIAPALSDQLKLLLDTLPLVDAELLIAHAASSKNVVPFDDLPDNMKTNPNSWFIKTAKRA